MTQPEAPSRPLLRRRLYLMRHGAVDYFGSDGSIAPPQGVSLNAQGRAQTDAAGRLFRASGVRFDRVMTSSLPRTVETARRVLAAMDQAAGLETETALQEIRGGRLADIPRDRLEQAFLGAFQTGGDIEAVRFLDGESIGQCSTALYLRSSASSTTAHGSAC
jgi:broad specificity phosphatase PhoE